MKVGNNVDDDDDAYERKAASDDEVDDDPKIVPFPSSSSSSSTIDQGIKKVGFLKDKGDDGDGNLLEVLSIESQISGEEIPKVMSLVTDDKKKDEKIHLALNTKKMSGSKEEKFAANNNSNPPTASASERRRRNRCKKEKVKQIKNEDEAAPENTTKPTSQQNNLQKEPKSNSSEIKGGKVGKDDVLSASQVHVRAPINWSCKKKLIVLDLNGLLVDVGKKSKFKRPFCDDFLHFCFERFNVGVWSSRTKENVSKVVDFVMGELKQNLLFFWDLSHCTDTGFRTIENRYKPLVLKELKKLWDKHEHSLPWEKGIYNESNTLLLDDSPYKALRNPLHTAIFPFSYSREDRDDNSLGPGGDIRVYLEGLVVAENVQKYVEQHPFGQSAITNMHPYWCFYQRVIRSNAPKMNHRMDISNIYFMGKWEHFKIK